MVDCGKNLWGASSGEQEVEVINGARGGLARIILNSWVSVELEEGSGAEKELDDSWCWLAWKLQRKKMVTPSFRSEGKRWGGCHCSKCMGVSQQESKGKGAEETQRRAACNDSLAENCFVARTR